MTYCTMSRLCWAGAAAIVLVVVAAARYPPVTEKMCYSCAYSHPREYNVTKEVWEQVGGYWSKREVTVTELSQGGWDACRGNFTHDEALERGIRLDRHCHSNCYERRNGPKDNVNGDQFRGCFKGAYDVDPNLIGCHEQAGDMWCFCEGNMCNNHGY